MSQLTQDPWGPLRRYTRARIGLPRTGDSIAGSEIRALQAAHACARRAVHACLDPAKLTIGDSFVEVRSQAKDRSEFVRRPDLGRRLDGPSLSLLKQIALAGPWDVVLVAADGLSAVAVERQAPPLQKAVRAALGHTWRIAPLVVAHNARVALGDEIGTLLGVRCVVMMIGERPGLSVSDSLSLYMTWNPHVGRQDSERNCISNIHAHGLSIGESCHKLCWLLNSARKLGYTGVALKDESTDMTPLPENNTP